MIRMGIRRVRHLWFLYRRLRKVNKLRIVAALAGATLLCLSSDARPAIGRAQQVPSKPLQYDISVTLKLIQVYVTDRNGRPVQDLTKEEFAVFDEGKPMSVTEFERYDFLAPPSPSDEQPVAKPAPAVETGRNRKFFLFFDFAYNDQRGAVAGLKIARSFLDSDVRPEDEVAVISYSALKGLRVHEFLTRDHAKIRRVLADLSGKDIAGRAEEIEQLYAMAIQEGFGDLTNAARFNLVSRRLESKNLAGDYFEALTSLAKAMRLVEGQKHFLFFSSGMPYSLIHGSEPAEGSRLGVSRGTTFDLGDPIIQPLSERTLKELSAANCSIFSFDTREAAKVASLWSFEDKREAIGGGDAPTIGGVVQPRTDLLRDDKTTGQHSLQRLSKETGGRYFANVANYVENLGSVQNLTGTYYVLGYPIRSPKDGEFHKIKVEVKRKDCRVQAQSGYYDPKPFSEYTDLEKQIHLFDLALNERSELQAPRLLQASGLSYDAGQGARVRAIARIPEETWSELGGKTAEIVALFFGEQDALLSLQRVVVASADYRGKEVLFSAGASARPGQTKCRIVIRDLDTGQSAVASTSVFTGASKNQALTVFSPLMVVEGWGVFLLEGAVKGTAESPSWRDLYPFDGASHFPVIGGEVVRAGKIGVILPYSAPSLGAGNLIFKANLIDSGSGANLAVPLEPRESALLGTITVQKFELSLADVPNGRYTLYIHVGSKVTGQAVSARVPLAVER